MRERKFEPLFHFTQFAKFENFCARINCLVFSYCNNFVFNYTEGVVVSSLCFVVVPILEEDFNAMLYGCVLHKIFGKSVSVTHLYSR